MHTLRRRHQSVRKAHAPRQRSWCPVIAVARNQAANSSDCIANRRRRTTKVEHLQISELVVASKKIEREQRSQHPAKPRESGPAEYAANRIGCEFAGRLQHVIQLR